MVAAKTMQVLRRCPLAIAQRLVHCAITVSTAVRGQSHKDNVHCTAAEEQPEVKEVQLSQPSSTSLLMISSGLRVQLHLPALDLTWNPVMTHMCVRVVMVATSSLKNAFNSSVSLAYFFSVSKHKRFKPTFICINTDTQYAIFWGNPLYQATNDT